MPEQKECLNEDQSTWRIVTDYGRRLSCLEMWPQGTTLDQVRKMYREKYPFEKYDTFVAGGFREGTLITRMERLKCPVVAIILG